MSTFDPTDFDDLDDAELTRKLYAHIGLSPDGSIPSSLLLPARPLNIPAKPIAVTEQLATILGTFALGEEVPYSEVIDTLSQIEGLKFSQYTLHIARRRAGIKTRHDGKAKQWIWYRPIRQA